LLTRPSCSSSASHTAECNHQRVDRRAGCPLAYGTAADPKRRGKVDGHARRSIGTTLPEGCIYSVGRCGMIAPTLTDERTSKFYEAAPSLYAEIDTFQEASVLALQGADWMELSRSELGEWVGSLLRAQLAGQENPAVRTDFDVAGTVSDEVSGETPGGNVKIGIYSQDHWRLMLQRFRVGKLRRCLFAIDGLDEVGHPGHRGGITVAVELQALEWPEMPNKVSIDARLSVEGDQLEELQDRLVDVMKSAAVTCDGSYGHITFDRTTHAYEDAVGRSFVQGATECREWARGYYWGNFLSRVHIERLGGIDRVMKEAPCFVVEDLSEGRGELVYLQLTPSVVRSRTPSSGSFGTSCSRSFREVARTTSTWARASARSRRVHSVEGRVRRHRRTAEPRVSHLPQTGLRPRAGGAAGPPDPCLV
jgi:hypothetical protein